VVTGNWLGGDAGQTMFLVDHQARRFRALKWQKLPSARNL
jgi:hypothetical protein